VKHPRFVYIWPHETTTDRQVNYILTSHPTQEYSFITSRLHSSEYSLAPYILQSCLSPSEPRLGFIHQGYFGSYSVYSIVCTSQLKYSTSAFAQADSSIYRTPFSFLNDMAAGVAAAKLGNTPRLTTSPWSKWKSKSLDIQKQFSRERVAIIQSTHPPSGTILTICGVDRTARNASRLFRWTGASGEYRGRHCLLRYPEVAARG